jgi:hypothetical protein
MNMSFETIFITEGRAANPAVEIQFKGQRLAVIRFDAAGSPQIEFVQDTYVGREVKMAFPVMQLQETVQQAVSDLAAWIRNLTDDRAEA